VGGAKPDAATWMEPRNEANAMFGDAPSSVPPRRIGEIVERQIRLWMLEQERRRAQARMVAEPVRPVVTISREAGSNGAVLGRLVAEKLGFQLWDQELVQGVAEQSGASEALLAQVDERARNAIEDLLASILMGDAGTEAGYLESLLRVIHAIASHGSAVIVGRGAQFVLAPERALRVRVVGPIESRTRELAAARSLSEREARVEVERLDRERLSFVRHHFHRSAADPSAYDLVVNAVAIPPPYAVDVVVAAYHAKFAAR
jgi:cytidylate kinase